MTAGWNKHAAAAASRALCVCCRRRAAARETPARAVDSCADARDGRRCVGPLPSSPLRSSVTPDSSTTPPPGPPSRPKSQSSKRAIRSRYVDVFQQPEGGAA
ncbi:hypothetical protein C8J57DRAFT_648567 [Mycena rebaudengoi]|nr:hypothetical protein C8J57DRAFT_648567 [Mycena rebaudengoi]